MKLKGAAKKMNVRTPLVFAAVLGAALIALRVYQSLRLIDPATGFFTDRANLTVPLFYALSVGGAVLIPLLFYVCTLSRAEYIAAETRPLHALAAVFAAVLTGFDGVKQVFTPADTSAAGNSVTAAAASRLPIAAAVTGVLAAAALLVIAASFFTGKDLMKKVRVLLLFPALWALCKTVSHFAVSANYLRNSALLIAVFADVFMMLFFFEYAKKLAGYGGDGNSPACLACACLTAILQFSAAATGLCGLAGRGEFLYAPFEAYRLAAALFALTAVAVLLTNRVPDYVPSGERIDTYPLPAEDAPENGTGDES